MGKMVDDFLDEIESVCKKHGLSISHEDSHGEFEIKTYNEKYMKWLRDAANYVEADNA